MCLGLPAQFDHAFFRRHLSGPLRPLHLRLMWGYFRWVRVVTTAPTLERVTGIDDCAVDICDCRLAEGKCQDRIDVCYKLDHRGEAPYNRRQMSEEMFRRGRARLHILTAGKRWELCHCCSCCCLILNVVNLCGEPFIHPSGSRPVRVTRATVCTGCEACVEACPLGVRAIEGVIDPSRCIGCGVCTAVCPQGAWGMSPVTSPPTLKPPPKWWSYVFGLFHLGYLNWLMLFYALSSHLTVCIHTLAATELKWVWHWLNVFQPNVSRSERYSGHGAPRGRPNAFDHP